MGVVSAKWGYLIMDGGASVVELFKGGGGPLISELNCGYRMVLDIMIGARTAVSFRSKDSTQIPYQPVLRQ